MLHREIRGTRIAAAWGGVGVTSQDPSNTCVTCALQPHRASPSVKVTGSRLSGRSPRPHGPDPRSFCFCCCGHRSTWPHPLPWLLQTRSIFLLGASVVLQLPWPDSNGALTSGAFSGSAFTSCHRRCSLYQP